MVGVLTLNQGDLQVELRHSQLQDVRGFREDLRGSLSPAPNRP